MPTPWASLVTPEPENIYFGNVGRGLMMRVGDDASAPHSFLDSLRMTTHQSSSGPFALTCVPAFRLELPAWTEGSVPFVSLHPFGILHLLATNQVPQQPFLQALGSIARRGPYFRIGVSVIDPCPLLRMLGTPGVYLSFCSDRDLFVSSRGG